MDKISKDPPPTKRTNSSHTQNDYERELPQNADKLYDVDDRGYHRVVRHVG